MCNHWLKKAGKLHPEMSFGVLIPRYFYIVVFLHVFLKLRYHYIIFIYLASLLMYEHIYMYTFLPCILYIHIYLFVLMISGEINAAEVVQYGCSHQDFLYQYYCQFILYIHM